MWSVGVINKAALLRLLRNHPDWDEEALAVRYDVEVTRKAVKQDIDILVSRLAHLCPVAETRTKLLIALYALTDPMSQYINSPECVGAVSSICNVTCAVGQKTSRVVHRVCEAFDITSHAEYNSKFAQLADALNPLTITRTGWLSIHPCDYLEMSNIDNSWSSCHNLEDGCYMAGTLSYLGDKVSMIFFTTERVDGPVYAAPKVTREVFAYGSDILLQSRLYPATDDIATMDTYRDMVQRTISTCRNIPNLWHKHSDIAKVLSVVHTDADAQHYEDYTFACYHPNVSIHVGLKDKEREPLVVGSKAFCVLCGEREVYESNTLLCGKCCGNVQCAGCGSWCDEWVTIDGNYYCHDCAYYCDHCNSYTTGPLVQLHRQCSMSLWVCPDCADALGVYCEECDAAYHREHVCRHLDVRVPV